MSGAAITAEAFADLQQRAERRGLHLTRSESDGVVRVFCNGKETTFDDLESIVVHASSPWDIPVYAAKPERHRATEQSQQAAVDEAHARAMRHDAGSASLQPIVHAWRGVDMDAMLREAACACGAAKLLSRAERCEACARDASLCAKLETTLAGTPEGIAEAAIARAAQR